MPPPADQHPQDVAHAASLADPEAYWGPIAATLEWHREPTRCLEYHPVRDPPSPSSSPSTASSPETAKDEADESRVEEWSCDPASGARLPRWTWFPGGEISTAHNCVDRHVAAGRGGDVAIRWDSPVDGGAKEVLTYAQLLEETETLAGVLREEGVRKGDVVLIYMPMIPAALIGILATVRLGAIHTVVFGGFAPPALAQRIDASSPRVILTASCGLEGGKPPLPYRDLVRAAVRRSSHPPLKTIVWQRDRLRWDPVAKEDGERNWQRLVKSGRARGLRAACVPVGSADGLYIIYTSGTTGSPKGVLRPAGGHAVGLAHSVARMFGVRGPGDTMFCASDIGWVVGHSYILYAPLLVGAATVLYEGKPVGTPDAGAFWRVAAEHGATTMFTAPTALRAIRRADPDDAQLASVGEAGGLRRLRALFLAGERSEPALVQAYQALLARYAAPGATVIDNWWSSESGSPISGIALYPSPSSEATPGTAVAPLPTRPGSAGKPAPGFDVRVVDDAGAELPRGTMGNIVLGLPLAPTALTTLWRDDGRFVRSYLARFRGAWCDTGDAGAVDARGYVHVMARADDVINVAAHRLSTGAIEQALTCVPGVAEAAVVPRPDELKGSLPFAFVALRAGGGPGSPVADEGLVRELSAAVREQIGAVAARLGGVVVGDGMIPRTRSGKTLRRVLRALVENAERGEFDAEVGLPSTIEDPAVVEVARARVREWFEAMRAREGKRERAKL